MSKAVPMAGEFVALGVREEHRSRFGGVPTGLSVKELLSFDGSPLDGRPSLSVKPLVCSSFVTNRNKLNHNFKSFSV